MRANCGGKWWLRHPTPHKFSLKADSRQIPLLHRKDQPATRGGKGFAAATITYSSYISITEIVQNDPDEKKQDPKASMNLAASLAHGSKEAST